MQGDVMQNKTADLVPAATRRKIDIFFARGLQRTQAKKTEELRGTFGSVAMSRYREGLTDESQFTEELRLLGYPEEDIPRYVAAGRLSYALDYFRDLQATWRDAVRKGNLSIEGYAGNLAATGLVSERIESYVLREVARLKPGEALSLEPIPKAFYETDEGKVIVDSIRRARRKRIFDRETEITQLQRTGMSVELATIYADNDDIRLAEKGEEE